MRDFRVAETVKFHILTTHIKPVVDQIRWALGESQEQEVEAAHSVFDQIWKKRTLPNMSVQEKKFTYSSISKLLKLSTGNIMFIEVHIATLSTQMRIFIIGAMLLNHDQL